MSRSRLAARGRCVRRVRLIADQGGAVQCERGRRAHRAWRGRSRARGVELASGETIAAAQGRHLLDWTRRSFTMACCKDWPAPPPTEVAARPASLSLRQGRHADPLCAQSAAALDAAIRISRKVALIHLTQRPGRRFARRQRSGARPPAGGADDLRRPADRARSDRARRQARRSYGCKCRRRHAS